jgi:hypothetical protein
MYTYLLCFCSCRSFAIILATILFLTWSGSCLGPVPDRRPRILPEVVLVRRWVIGVPGIWRGEGLGKGWVRGGQFTSNLRPRWTSQLGGFQVSRRGLKGEQRGDKGEPARGDKSKGNAPCIVVHCNLCPYI